MKIKEILTSIQCDEAERCINLEDLTFQSTILAEIDTEKNGSEKPISKKSKYCMDILTLSSNHYYIEFDKTLKNIFPETGEKTQDLPKTSRDLIIQKIRINL
jgi:hypothetical protein